MRHRGNGRIKCTFQRIKEIKQHRQFSLSMTFFNIASGPFSDIYIYIYSETSRLAGWLHLDISSLRRWLSPLINQRSSQTPPAKLELIWPNAGAAKFAASRRPLFTASYLKIFHMCHKTVIALICSECTIPDFASLTRQSSRFGWSTLVLLKWAPFTA